MYTKFPTLITRYPRFWRIGLFLFSGGTAAGVQLCSYLVFSRILGFSYLIASAYAFVIAVIVSFTLQKFVTFNNRELDRAGRQFLLFTTLALCNLCANIGSMFLLVDILSIHDIVAQISTMAIIAIWSFVVYQRFIFKPTTEDDTISRTF